MRPIHTAGAPHLVVILWLSSACGIVEPDDPYAHVDFDGTAEVEADTVRYTLLVFNRSSVDVPLVSGGCLPNVALLVHDVQGAGGRIRWDEQRWRDQRPCFPYLVDHTIPAGDRRSFAGRVPVARILGDSLPDQRYVLALRPQAFEPGSRLVEVDLSGRTVPVGEAILTRP